MLDACLVQAQIWMPPKLDWQQTLFGKAFQMRSKAPALTIAALNRTAAGGAFGMILDCDVRVAPIDAKLFYPVVELGFLPQPPHVFAMRDLICPARSIDVDCRAKDQCTTGV